MRLLGCILAPAVAVLVLGAEIASSGASQHSLNHLNDLFPHQSPENDEDYADFYADSPSEEGRIEEMKEPVVTAGVASFLEGKKKKKDKKRRKEKKRKDKRRKHKERKQDEQEPQPATPSQADVLRRLQREYKQAKKGYMNNHTKEEFFVLKYNTLISALQAAQ